MNKDFFLLVEIGSFHDLAILVDPFYSLNCLPSKLLDLFVELLIVTL